MRSIPSCLLVLCCLAVSAQAAGQLAIAPLPAPRAASPGRAKVIAQLARRTAAIRQEAEECARPDPKNAEFTSQVAILLDTPTLYSVQVIGEDGCPGTAHPSSWQYALTYDMTTGRRYNPLKLYQVGFQGKYGTVKLTPAAIQLMRAQLWRRADPECRAVAAEQLPDTGMSFGLSRQGLNVYFDAAHAVQACFSPITLPYGQIRPFLNRREAARLHWRL